MIQPITMEEARELEVPECFSVEYAFLERSGDLPPYAGPVEPDWGSDAYDPYMDERYDDEPTEPPGWSEEPDPEWVREPPQKLEVMPTGREGHQPWCDFDHAPDTESCPPPF